MAQADILIPFVLSWEGGYVNNPDDKGGPTNMGVTLSTYSRYCRYKAYPRPTIERLQNLPMDTWHEIFKIFYWNVCRADEIENQAIANLVVDWFWCSGKWAIKYTQQVLGVEPDGVVGPITLAALNSMSPLPLFTSLWNRRELHFKALAHRKGQGQFLKGWLNRLHSITYHGLINNE